MLCIFPSGVSDAQLSKAEERGTYFPNRNAKLSEGIWPWVFQEHTEIEKSKQQALSFRIMASFGGKKKTRALHVSCKDQKLVLRFPHTVPPASQT